MELWSDSCPGLDCISRGHLWVERTGSRFEPNTFLTQNGEAPQASWCLWCGTGVSNEFLPDQA